MTERPSGAASASPEWTLGILAGGRSRRMGRDKALIPFGRMSMLEHVIARCRPPSGAVLLSGPDELLRDFPWPIVPDLETGGPLAGIHALSVAAETELLAIVPCDMPYLSADLLGPLLDRAARDCDIAFYAGLADEAEPLPCVVRGGAAAEAARELLGGPSRRILSLGDRLRVGVVPRPADDTVLGNVNTPEDLAAAVKFFAATSS